ncbi:regulator of microtubule dynamics protein 1-like [Battus philenor]|uniref:regulator of microtubule dynamics protein 1-like n=1 Tax=Battus philenor TaxID=42288 RepID=UPI0035CE912F
MFNNKILFLRSALIRIVRKQTNFTKYISDVPNLRNVKSTFTLGIAGFGFLWSKPATKSDKKDDIIMIIEKADKEFDSGHYEDCYQTLNISKLQDNVDVRWRLCRALYNMAKDSKYDLNYRKNLITQAYEIIENEITKSQENYAVHKWFALILEAKTSYEGYKERIKQLDNIKEHMDMAVTLNPNDATTLHMLGEWCFQLTEMPWHQRKTAELLFCPLPTSSYEDALEYFLKAESVQPRFYSINLLRLGNCYLKLNKEDQAKYYLQLAASYPAKSNEDHKANKEATELLKKIK